MDHTHHTLAALLRKRLHIIGDFAWRDRDPALHLHALGEISHKIESWHQEHKSHISGELNHYLLRRSYAKALAYAEKPELVA